MSKLPNIAYLVVCWNNREIIDECIKSIQKQEGVHASIYVIDNNSSDSSAEYIGQKYPKVKLIASKSNNGFARGNNILIKEALKDEATEYVALINSDAVIASDWSIQIVEYINSKAKVACAQGVTLDYYDHGTIDAEHIYVARNLQSIQYGYGDRFKASYAYPRRVFGVNAAAAIYTRDFIENQPESNLFDERFYMYLEDVDVSFRALVTGWDSYYIPAAKAYHMGSVSSKKRSSGYNIEMTTRNQAALMFKNMSTAVFIRLLPDALRFEKHFYMSLKRQYGSKVAWRTLRARFVGIMRLPLYIASRYRIRKHAALDNESLVRIMRQSGIR